MLALSLLALAGLASAATDPRYQYTACNSQQLQYCQAQFNDYIGLNDPTLGVQQYRELSLAIQDVWKQKGAAGQRLTCDAFKGYKSCFDTSTGITLEQAYGYTKIFNQNDFVCASGFPQFANNEACGVQVFSNNVQDLTKCDDEFYANVKASSYNPSLICTYVDIAKKCVQNVFAQACPSVYALQWWGCQWERTGTQTNFPQCTQIFCTMNEKGEQ